MNFNIFLPQVVVPSGNIAKGAKKYLVAGEVHQYVYDGTYWVYVGTIADNVLIYVDEPRETLFITTSLSSGDGVRY